MEAVLDAIDISTVATAIGLLAVAIVGIAMTLKGPDVAKRVVRKI